jgi:hypothetical protein
MNSYTRQGLFALIENACLDTSLAVVRKQFYRTFTVRHLWHALVFRVMLPCSDGIQVRLTFIGVLKVCPRWSVPHVHNDQMWYQQANSSMKTM